MDLPTAIHTLKTSNPLWWDGASESERGDALERLISLTDEEVATFEKPGAPTELDRELWALVRG